MKNLFKNLMLVAVAAMAFTACTETNDEVNAVVKKTVINGVAMIDADDTRSGFVGSETTENENGESVTVYKSAWDGDETIKLFAENGLATTATINAEGKFTAEFEGELPESFYMTVCSPAEAWSDAYTYTIPTEQTPRAESVDPAAHIFQAQNVYVTNGTADKIQMSHQIAYGKMTVKGVDFKIDHVVVDLKGSFYGYARELSYTLNAANVENNTFWFATEIIDVANFTVTAYDAEGNAVTKSVDVAAAEDKTLAFNYGRVSTFSVSGLKEVEAPAAPAFTSATWTNNWAPDDKLIEFHSEELGTLQLNFYKCNSDACLDARTYGFAYSGDIYPGGTYSWYENESLGIDTEICGGTVIVSVVDGQYFIEFKNLVDWDGKEFIEYAKFKGEISGLQLPDTREKLAAPSATATVEGKTITISWNAVDNVNGYRVKLYSPYDEYFEEVVTGTEYVYEAQQWGTTYSFTIMSYASDDNKTYKSSDDAYVYATIGANPDYTYEWATAKARWYGSANFTIEALSTDERSKFYFDMYCPEASDKLLPEGTYTYGSQSSTHYIGYGGVAIDVANPNYQVTVTNSGTVTVEHIEGGYKFTINVNGMNSVYEGRVEDLENSGVINPGDGTTDPGSGDGGETPDPENPNVFADYIYDTLTWNSMYSRFELTGGGNGMTQFYVNSSDSPNNNSIKVGTYTYAGNTVSNPSVGTFSLRHLLGSGAGSSHYIYDASMSVTVEEGQYCILITIIDAGNENVVGKTFGYKGLPNGFVLPDEGGDDNIGDGGDSGDEGDGFIQMTKLYYDNSAANLHNFVLANADQSCKFTLSFNNQDVLSNWIPVYTYHSQSLNYANNNPGYFTLQYEDAKINGTSYSLNATGNTLKVLSSSNGGNHELELYVVLSNGTEYKFKFSGSLGL